MFGRHLVCGDAAKGRIAATWWHTAEPGTRRDRMHGATARGLVVEAGYHRQVFAVGFERFQNWLEIKILADDVGRHVLHDSAVRQIEKAHAWFGRRCGFGNGRGGRHHRIQKRQRNAGTQST